MKMLVTVILGLGIACTSATLVQRADARDRRTVVAPTPVPPAVVEEETIVEFFLLRPVQGGDTCISAGRQVSLAAIINDRARNQGWRVVSVSPWLSQDCANALAQGAFVTFAKPK